MHVHCLQFIVICSGTNATRNSAKILEALVHGRPGISDLQKTESLIELLVGVGKRLLYRNTRRNFSSSEIDFASKGHTENFLSMCAHILYKCTVLPVLRYTEGSSSLHVERHTLATTVVDKKRVSNPANSFNREACITPL